jgi:hypothetical protein
VLSFAQRPIPDHRSVPGRDGDDEISSQGIHE